MFDRDSLRSSTIPPLLLSLALLAVSLLAARAAVPFTQASVTKVENKVDYGEVKEGRTLTRPAKVADIVRARNFLLSETDSRAELQYEDGSVVRIGQNTVFSFDAATRTLTLDRGSLIFYIPKGAGGGTIKTPGLTAAITGTVGKVAENLIAIIEGEVTLKPSKRKVATGFVARRLPDGRIIIEPWDLGRVWEGRLMMFNGPMPGVDRSLFAALPLTLPDHSTLPGSFKMPDFSIFDALDRTQNNPGALLKFFPPAPPVIRNENQVGAPPPLNQPPNTNRPGGGLNY